MVTAICTGRGRWSAIREATAKGNYVINVPLPGLLAPAANNAGRIESSRIASTGFSVRLPEFRHAGVQRIAFTHTIPILDPRIMNYLQLHFRGRGRWLGIPVGDAEFNRARDLFSENRTKMGFLEFTSLLGNSVWINPERVQMLRFLLEAFPLPLFSVSDLKDSAQEHLVESEEDLDDVHWEVSIWLTGRDRPVKISELSGNDWVEITTSLGDSMFFFVTDEDGEEIAVQTGDIELLVGTEYDRYSDDQIEAALAEVDEQEMPGEKD
jgi:hypothetical protein